ncbi:hypothetical protein ACFL6Z_07195 [Pseudomonadota bacterium]|nr:MULTISPECIES: hypothetical protein [unclassified Shewanella]MDO6619692.1 hypothetical protein [Shewanella sp. 6_MG-2023]MDO6678780.1 hypothetical protein [Shewanella sp. 4_MG-2023]
MKTILAIIEKELIPFKSKMQPANNPALINLDFNTDKGMPA